MSLAQLNNLIFENSNNMNEGLYLKLMDATKAIFQEQKEQEQHKEKEIKELKTEIKNIKNGVNIKVEKEIEYKEYRKYLLNKITKIDNQSIRLCYKDMSVITIHLLDFFKVMDYGRDEIYYKLVKITDKQCKFIKYHYKYIWVEDNHKLEEETITIKFNVNQEHKNIVFFGNLDGCEAFDMYLKIDEIAIKDE